MHGSPGMLAMTRTGTSMLLLALLWGSGCAANIGESCDSESDCESGAGCVPPGSPRVCGICSSDERTCEADEDCAEGSHCAEYEPICPTCSGLLPTWCVADCSAGGCGDDARCDAGTGRCLPLQCTSGEFPYECPSNFRCADGGDEHGCVRLSCDRDRDCDHGACVNGACWDGEGTCMGPVP